MNNSVERQCTFFPLSFLLFFFNHMIMNFLGLGYSNLRGTIKAGGQLNKVGWEVMLEVRAQEASREVRLGGSGGKLGGKVGGNLLDVAVLRPL